MKLTVLELTVYLSICMLFRLLHRLLHPGAMLSARLSDIPPSRDLVVAGIIGYGPHSQ